MNLKITRIDKSFPLPKYQTLGACAFDFYSREDLCVSPGEIKLAPTNLIIEVPNGFSLLILARSSLPIKKGLMVANGPGLIDRDYCGPTDEIKIQLLNFTNEVVSVKKGDRIAQCLFVKSENMIFEEVDEMKSDSRGGFGTTGE